MEEEKKMELNNDNPKFSLQNPTEISKGILFKQKPLMNRPQIADSELTNGQSQINSNDIDGPSKLIINEIQKNVKV